jgi:hypothetical protein
LQGDLYLVDLPRFPVTVCVFPGLFLVTRVPLSLDLGMGMVGSEAVGSFHLSIRLMPGSPGSEVAVAVSFGP